MIDFYQTIPELGIKGKFNTLEECEKIGLPEKMDDWCVLDIGCNMGAYLLECAKRGATCLGGVEPNLVWRLLANGVASETDHSFIIFPKLDINNYLGHGMDLVLLLSVTHVAEGITGQELIDQAYKLTKSGGLLIIEINDRLQKEDLRLPEEAVFYAKSKDNRSTYHIVKV